MKEFLIAWFSKPENLILLAIGIVQFYKLIRQYLPANVSTNLDKAAGFLSWAVPAGYHGIEALEARGVIDKNAKFSKFLDGLFEAAVKQNITLSAADILKAKLMVEGIAQASKAPASLPTAGVQVAELLKTPLPGVSPSR